MALFNPQQKRLTTAATPTAAQAAFPGSTKLPAQVQNSKYTNPALFGDFLGGGGTLQAPNVKRPTANFQAPTTGPMAPKAPTTNPGVDMYNSPGLSEQAFNYTQNRLLEDPSQAFLTNAANRTNTQTQGEQYLNRNLGTLDGPGSGQQYWNQVSGQFMDPFAGEQFARQATQQFQANGPASGFYDQAMGQYGQFTNYQGPQNAQGQYGASSGALANGTQGENYLAQLGQQYGSMGQYNGQNLSAGQYGQTQQAFGDLPIANFDPFYDRARQLATQDYNRQAAGRGVYGSSEALSGVGNVITDIEAQRANRSFDAEMQRAQEQRMRQQLLGEQARMGDLSSLAAFQSNLQGLNTFADIGKSQGQLELGRHQTLGSMANAADSQALGAQNANISGINAFGNLAQAADAAETNRYQASTNAMNQADRTALDRLNSGVENAFKVDDANRADFIASTNAANQAAGLSLDRTRLGADIASQASRNDLARLEAFNNQANTAENSRQSRLTAALNATAGYSRDVQGAISGALQGMIQGDYASTEEAWQMEILPKLQEAGMDQKQIDQLQAIFNEAMKMGIGAATGGGKK